MDPEPSRFNYLKTLKRMADSETLSVVFQYYFDISFTESKLLTEVSKRDFKKIARILRKNKKGIPLAYLLGKWSFLGANLKIDKNVLVPRFDTEILASEAVRLINENNYKTALDLCTGSGAIAIYIDKSSGASLSASDISKKALKIARENADKNQCDITFYESDLLGDIDEKFDIIVSNPPYIKTKEIGRFDKTILREPKIALDGGGDGLNFYRRIIGAAREHLNGGGSLIFEIGEGQEEDIETLLADAGFGEITSVNDLNGTVRVIFGKLI
ncbi:MAG: peptide chain release factor N(5)-glutamine methyltransferase [Christensenellaceae bacterium]|jgi:release factor glutamine methyltransferase|nr:peptide chain release factor N(5)-glutamine methyltransferase [Christensenellaceae bacterium]